MRDRQRWAVTHPHWQAWARKAKEKLETHAEYDRNQWKDQL